MYSSITAVLIQHPNEIPVFISNTKVWKWEDITGFSEFAHRKTLKKAVILGSINDYEITQDENNTIVLLDF